MTHKKIIRNVLRFLAAVVPMSLLVGCVGDRYYYNNVTYNSRVEATRAATQHGQQIVDKISKFGKSIPANALVVIPDRSLIERMGVRRDAATKRVFIEYIIDTQEIAINNRLRSLRKAEVFKDVISSTSSSPRDVSVGSHDFKLWVQAESFGVWQWYISSKKAPSGKPITSPNRSNIAESEKAFHAAIYDIASAIGFSREEQKTQEVREENEPKSRSSGTGFFVNASGDILTNFHVVDGCEKIAVFNSNLGFGNAMLKANDPRNDLAVLSSSLKNKSHAVLGTRRKLKQGAAVAVFGYPYSGTLSSGGNYSEGIVSALSGLGDDTRLLQISAPVQPGNSGGPLVDKEGNVVGVVTSKLNALKVASVTGDIPQNVNFAIKSEVAELFLNSSDVEYSSIYLTTKKSSVDLAENTKNFSVNITCF